MRESTQFHISLPPKTDEFLAANHSELVNVGIATFPRSSCLSLENRSILERKDI